MIPRTLASVLQKRAQQYPIVTLLGPRQSGKTTLAKATFPHKPYVSLEPLDTQLFAQSDPRGFLAQFPDGAVLDEVQNVPSLFHYLQDIVDDKKQNGMFILTGSENFLLSEKISQSLAGRTNIITLLPFSHGELMQGGIDADTLWEQVWKGGYPRIYDQQIEANVWLPDYIFTYLQKDIRQIINIENIDAFSRFLPLIASRTAQEVNYSTLASDVGVSSVTIQKWCHILYESFLAFPVRPWTTHTKKRVVKSPKFHFFDTGLVCNLLEITTPQQLQLHPLRGSIFETWVASELYKKYAHQGKKPLLSHYRETAGVEFDLVERTDTHLNLIEIKSAQTIHTKFFKYFDMIAEQENFYEDSLPLQNTVVYGGDESQKRSIADVLSWKEL